MVIKLHRYYGDAEITKSVMEVFMEGEEEPRMRCEAREVAYKDYTESFAGASHFCLPRGTWPMKPGRSPYGPMGLRVTRCPGHRQVFIGHKWARQAVEGEVLVGRGYLAREWDSEAWGDDPVARKRWEDRKRRIRDGEEVWRELDELVYEAYGRGEEFWLEVDDKV